jgi:peptidoglycan/LPS O-acetylase OafA/YrhL
MAASSEATGQWSAAAPFAERVRGLDGLRALFILLVVLFHLRLLGGGWIGVSLFFVLSGYLITRVLLRDAARTSGAGALFARFYARRSLRIFPIYYAWLALLAAGLALSGYWQEFAPYLAGAASYTSNVFIALRPANFVALPTEWLNYLWSLAVEEQFYLVWPLLIALVPQRRLGAMLLLVALAGLLSRALIMQWWTASWLPPEQRAHSAAVALYYLTVCHLDTFAIGAALNLVRWAPRLRTVLALLALTLVLGLLANRGSGVPWKALTLGYPPLLEQHGEYLWGHLLLGIDGAALIACARSPGLLQRLMSLRWLEWVGERSYGAYLYHVPVIGLTWPLIAAVGQRVHSDKLGALLCLPLVLAILFAVCALSYRFIEMPALNLKRRHFSTAGAAAGAAMPANRRGV